MLVLQVRGDIEHAQETLEVYRSSEATISKTLKQYQQGVEHLAKAQGKLERVRAEANTNPKAKLRISEVGCYVEDRGGSFRRV